MYSNRKIVIYIDLKKSRTIKDRNLYKDKLYKTLDLLNDKYSDYLLVKIETIKGIDELEMILNSPKVLLNIISDFIYKMKQYQYWIVAIQDEIDIKGDRVSEMDGNAFHYISPMIESNKKKNYHFQSRLDNGMLQLLLNTNINMLLEYWYSLSVPQFEIFQALKQGKSQQEYADEKDISQQYISKVFNNINGNLYIWIENQINEYINSIE